jgi:hypothetical protein
MKTALPNREAQCEGKEPFKSFRKADKVAKKMRRRRDKAYVAAYLCPFCK